MKEFSPRWKQLLIIGWLLFWISLFLPVNTSVGGLTDAGKSYSGFLNLFYSISSLFALPTLIFNRNSIEDLSFVLGVILAAGIGICNLLMIFFVPFAIFGSRIKLSMKNVMSVCAVYVCIAGSIISWHFYPILYGHYIWCLSFMITAVALQLKAKNMATILQSCFILATLFLPYYDCFAFIFHARNL